LVYESSTELYPYERLLDEEAVPAFFFTGVMIRKKVSPTGSSSIPM
jgi:hypothetical protein